MSNNLREHFDTAAASTTAPSPRLSGRIKAVALMVATLLSGCVSRERTTHVRHRFTPRPSAASASESNPLTAEEWFDQRVDPTRPRSIEDEQAGEIFREARNESRRRRINALPIAIGLRKIELSRLEVRIEDAPTEEQRALLEMRRDTMKEEITTWEAELHQLRVAAGLEEPGF